ncbi:MAG TPA: SUMF1/EgtB/PvdO family nonheme iron enzyme, partial [Humisphaera sp.]
MRRYAPRLILAAATLASAAPALAADAAVAERTTYEAWTVYQDWPFDAAEAARRQAEATKALAAADPLATSLEPDGPVIRWRLIPAGRFVMGSPATEPGHEKDEAQREERVAEPFYLMETQLTVGQYHALLGVRPPDAPAEADPELPAPVAYRDA